MHPRHPRSRWLAASLYITAILGALVAPHSHHHHAGSSCCPTTDASSCSTASEHTHSHACGHSHSHETPAGDTGDSHEPTSPTDHNCPVCRFLAQSVDLADPPRITESAALALAVEGTTVAVPALRDEFRLPARGPPSA